MSINDASSLASLLGGFDDMEGTNPMAITLAPAAPPHSVPDASFNASRPAPRIPGPAGVVAQRLARGLPAPEAHEAAHVPDEATHEGMECAPAWQAALAALDVSAGVYIQGRTWIHALL